MTRHIKTGIVTIVGLGLVAVMISPADAQRGRGFGRMFGVSKARLATLDAVQTELKMTDEQKTETEAINEQLRHDLRGLWGGNFGPGSELLSETDRLNHEASAKVDALLDEAQRMRLQEIMVQINNAAALNDPGVVEALTLSDDQKSQLEEIRSEHHEAVTETFANVGQLSRGESRQKFVELNEATGKKLLAVLTDEQRSQFEQMKSDPVQIDMSELRRGFRRGGQN